MSRWEQIGQVDRHFFRLIPLPRLQEFLLPSEDSTFRVGDFPPQRAQKNHWDGQACSLPLPCIVSKVTDCWLVGINYSFHLPILQLVRRGDPSPQSTPLHPLYSLHRTTMRILSLLEFFKNHKFKNTNWYKKINKNSLSIDVSSQMISHRKFWKYKAHTYTSPFYYSKKANSINLWFILLNDYGA